MKVVIGGVECEGTPQEVMELMRALSPHATPVQPSPDATVLVHDPTKDEEYFDAYRRRAGAAPSTIEANLREMRILKAHVAPRSVMDATSADIRAVAERMLQRCRNLYTYSSHTKTPGWHKCKAKRFARDNRTTSPAQVRVSGPGVTPSFCNKVCPDYQINPFPANAFVQACGSFFNLFEDEFLRNPARSVVREYNVTLNLAEHSADRYCPTLEKAQHLVKGAITPAVKVLVVLALKSGRRLDELRLIEWEHVDLVGGWINLDHVRRKKMRAAGRGRAKLQRLSCSYIFLDDEAITTLTWYKAIWETIVACDEKGEPLTQALWLGQGKDDVASKSTMQELFGQGLKEAGLWELHGLGAAERWTLHCCRHFFTTEGQLDRKTGALRPEVRPWVKWLRGDRMGDAMKKYERFTPQALRAMALEFIPILELDEIPKDRAA